MYRKNLTPEQIAARDEKRANFRAMAKKIAAMTDAKRDALAASLPLIATVEGRILSQHNRIMIAYQNASATLVGGFRQWLKAGRCVRKGERGLSIWCASPIKGEAGDADGVKFITGTVFDVSQTDPVEVREMVAA